MSTAVFFLTTAVQVGASIAEGQARSEALEAEAEGLKLQSQAAREQAQDRIDQANRQLAGTLSAQKAIFASRGVNVGSPTAIALARDSEGAAQRDVSIIQRNAARQRQQLMRSAAARREEARSASLLGFLGAGATAGRRFFDFRRLGS